jgi:hypothetical protein
VCVLVVVLVRPFETMCDGQAMQDEMHLSIFFGSTSEMVQQTAEALRVHGGVAPHVKAVKHVRILLQRGVVVVLTVVVVWLVVIGWVGGLAHASTSPPCVACMCYRVR